MSLLELKNVKSEVEGKEILKGLNLTINKGEVHVIIHLQVFLWDIQNTN